MRTACCGAVRVQTAFCSAAPPQLESCHRSQVADSYLTSPVLPLLPIPGPTQLTYLIAPQALALPMSITGSDSFSSSLQKHGPH